jgi:hypothetical protein
MRMKMLELRSKERLGRRKGDWDRHEMPLPHGPAYASLAVPSVSLASETTGAESGGSGSGGVGGNQSNQRPTSNARSSQRDSVSLQSESVDPSRGEQGEEEEEEEESRGGDGGELDHYDSVSLASQSLAETSEGASRGAGHTSQLDNELYRLSTGNGRGAGGRAQHHDSVSLASHSLASDNMSEAETEGGSDGRGGGGALRYADSVSLNSESRVSEGDLDIDMDMDINNAGSFFGNNANANGSGNQRHDKYLAQEIGTEMHEDTVSLDSASVAVSGPAMAARGCKVELVHQGKKMKKTSHLENLSLQSVSEELSAGVAGAGEASAEVDFDDTVSEMSDTGDSPEQCAARYSWAVLIASTSRLFVKAVLAIGLQTHQHGGSVYDVAGVDGSVLLGGPMVSSASVNGLDSNSLVLEIPSGIGSDIGSVVEKNIDPNGTPFKLDNSTVLVTDAMPQMLNILSPIDVVFQFSDAAVSIYLGEAIYKLGSLGYRNKNGLIVYRGLNDLMTDDQLRESLQRERQEMSRMERTRRKLRRSMNRVRKAEAKALKNKNTKSRKKRKRRKKRHHIAGRRGVSAGRREGIVSRLSATRKSDTPSKPDSSADSKHSVPEAFARKEENVSFKPIYAKVTFLGFKIEAPVTLLQTLVVRNKQVVQEPRLVYLSGWTPRGRWSARTIPKAMVSVDQSPGEGSPGAHGSAAKNSGNGSLFSSSGGEGRGARGGASCVEELPVFLEQRDETLKHLQQQHSSFLAGNLSIDEGAGLTHSVFQTLRIGELGFENSVVESDIPGGQRAGGSSAVVLGTIHEDQSEPGLANGSSNRLLREDQSEAGSDKEANIVIDAIVDGDDDGFSRGSHGSHRIRSEKRSNHAGMVDEVTSQESVSEPRDNLQESSLFQSSVLQTEAEALPIDMHKGNVSKTYSADFELVSQSDSDSGAYSYIDLYSLKSGGGSRLASAETQTGVGAGKGAGVSLHSCDSRRSSRHSGASRASRSGSHSARDDVSELSADGNFEDTSEDGSSLDLVYRPESPSQAIEDGSSLDIIDGLDNIDAPDHFQGGLAAESRSPSGKTAAGSFASSAASAVGSDRHRSGSRSGVRVDSSEDIDEGRMERGSEVSLGSVTSAGEGEGGEERDVLTSYKNLINDPAASNTDDRDLESETSMSAAVSSLAQQDMRHSIATTASFDISLGNTSSATNAGLVSLSSDAGGSSRGSPEPPEEQGDSNSDNEHRHRQTHSRRYRTAPSGSQTLRSISLDSESVVSVISDSSGEESEDEVIRPEVSLDSSSAGQGHDEDYISLASRSLGVDERLDRGGGGGIRRDSSVSLDSASSRGTRLLMVSSQKKVSAEASTEASNEQERLRREGEAERAARAVMEADKAEYEREQQALSGDRELILQAKRLEDAAAAAAAAAVAATNRPTAADTDADADVDVATDGDSGSPFVRMAPGTVATTVWWPELEAVRRAPAVTFASDVEGSGDNANDAAIYNASASANSESRGQEISLVLPQLSSVLENKNSVSSLQRELVLHKRKEWVAGVLRIYQEMKFEIRDGVTTELVAKFSVPFADFVTNLDQNHKCRKKLKVDVRVPRKGEFFSQCGCLISSSRRGCSSSSSSRRDSISSM